MDIVVAGPQSSLPSFWGVEGTLVPPLTISQTHTCMHVCALDLEPLRAIWMLVLQSGHL